MDQGRLRSWRCVLQELRTAPCNTRLTRQYATYRMDRFAYMLAHMVDYEVGASESGGRADRRQHPGAEYKVRSLQGVSRQ
jgi:hypothetical protein